MGLTLIKALTADEDATLSFVDGASDVVFDNTYNEYQFQFVNMHPETNSVLFGFQVNATDDAGGGYDTSLITSTWFAARHYENDAVAAIDYSTGLDLAQSAAHQILAEAGNDDDQSVSGTLTIYDPSSTTYVKHFTASFNFCHAADITLNSYIAGYINDTTAIDEISFKMSSGDIDDGTIYMYGVS